jgi:hypothetical protein
VLAARVKDGDDRQIGVREEPIVGSGAGRFGNRSRRPEVLVSGQTSEMLAADSGEAGCLFLGEDLLARPDSDHLGLSICVMLQQG